jgi:hypothetical protein
MNTNIESLSSPTAAAGHSDAPMFDGNGYMLRRYESSMGSARTQILELVQSTVLDPGIDPCVLRLFLIHFSAQGVGMTEPVESWVDRAGQRCEQIGLAELGRFLRMHSGEEANHHLWFIDDLRLLIPMWNACATESLSVDELLRRPLTGGVHRYRKLFEDVIAGDAPFAELAIEYEIENLSLLLGPPFVGQCQRVLGPEITAGLSFVRQHIALDAGHTDFNAHQLGEFLDAHPDYLPQMVAAGKEGLGAYGAFVEDCFHLAQAGVRV